MKPEKRHPFFIQKNCIVSLHETNIVRFKANIEHMVVKGFVYYLKFISVNILTS